MAGQPHNTHSPRTFGPLAAALVVGAFGSLSCVRGAPGPEDGPILVGVVMPQTGTLGTDGQLWLKGIQLATQEINAAGGPLPGRPVELVVLDSQTDSDVAVSQAQRVLEEGAVAIIGDAGSGGTLAIYQGVTQMAGVPQVSCCATSPSLTEASMASGVDDRFFFRTAPSDALQGQVVARVADDEACTRMVIVHMDDAYGTPLAGAIRATFTSAGGTVVATVPYVDGRAMYTTEAQQVATANPECVALIAYPRTAGIFLRNYTSLSMPPNVVWIGTDGLRSDTFITEVGAALLSGVEFFGAAPITQPEGPVYESFSAQHRAAFGTPPGPFVSNNYDAAALLFLGIARADSTSGRGIMQAVRSLDDPAGAVVRVGGLAEALERIQAGEPVNYEGASGSVDVDENGDVRTDYEVWRVSTDGMRIEQIRRVLASELR